MSTPSDQNEVSEVGSQEKITHPPLQHPRQVYDPGAVSESSPYPQGIRFWLIVFSITTALLLTNLEIPIVTTSLIAITDDIGGLDKASWLISSYLLGYVGVVMIFAKLSDIFGRRPILATAIGIFVVGSAACGAAQTAVQLIVFRAFQGIGGGGCFGIGVTMLTDIGPPEKWAMYGASIAMVYAVSLLTGSILGGAISENTTWRWVFLINIPCGVPALLCAWFSIPKDFPRRQSRDCLPSCGFKDMFLTNIRPRVDIIGGILLLLATLTLTAGFEEANSSFPWRSAYVITLLVASALLWIATLYWERRVTLADGTLEPVMPWTFFTNRVVLSLLLDCTFLGGTWLVVIFILPQKFQLVHRISALQAGLRTMPFTFSAPLGAAFSSVASGRLKIPVIFVLLLSALLQVIGFALLSTLPKTVAIPARLYGYQIIAGFGCGITISLPALVMPFILDVKHRSVGIGAVGQVRIMGGAIVLAISTSVFNGYVRPRQRNLLPTDNISSLRHLTGGPLLQEEVTSILAQGYHRQVVVLCAFAGAQTLAIALMWQKKPLRI